MDSATVADSATVNPAVAISFVVLFMTADDESVSRALHEKVRPDCQAPSPLTPDPMSQLATEYQRL